MDNYKNGIIAVLAGLLALTLSTPNAQSAPVKTYTYDAMALVEYQACLNFGNIQYPQAVDNQYAIRNIGMYSSEIASGCRGLRPLGK